MLHYTSSSYGCIMVSFKIFLSQIILRKASKEEHEYMSYGQLEMTSKYEMTKNSNSNVAYNVSLQTR